MEYEEKLKKFQSAVFNEIETKKDKATIESSKEFARKLRENTDRKLQTSYDDIQQKTADIKKDTKREIAKMGLDNKRTLISKRNELVETMFKSIENKILNFVKTQEYQDYFLDEIENFSRKYEISNVEIYIGQIDKNKEIYIQKAYKLPCSVVIDKRITLGGFAIKDEESCMYYDYTLHNKLKENKVDFVGDKYFVLN